MNIRFIVIALVLTGFTVPGFAALKKSGSSGGGNAAAIMKAQKMIQQYKSEADRANAELAKLRKENEKLAKENKRLQKTISGKQKELQYAAGSLQNYKGGYNNLQERMVTMQGKMQELIEKFRETITTLKQTEAERNLANSRLKKSESQLLSCAQNNVKLYDTNRELLGQYESKGVWAALKQQEPLTQLSQVQIENMIQDYRDIIDDLKVELVARDEHK
ncbi:MAG: hypothetical protein D6B27_10065 [Gammaproteobacteria bacterium]|nr:MAG: hypothetical protein D6B27_10065 [Gammaproteobacteria bacterium]